MDYYKQVKALGLTSGTRLTLIDAAYKHKGFMINGSAASDFKLEFVSGGTFSAGITIGNLDPNTGNIFNSIIPIRLAAITPTGGGGGKIFLFN
jgi:hypothetical protein